METIALDGGFGDAPQEAACAFRKVLGALARPGRIETVAGAAPPPPVSVAAGVVLLTLCDPDTPLHLGPSRDQAAVRDWIRFHTGAPLVSAREAMFALGTWAELNLDDFPIGTPEYPDRSATLIVECDTLSGAGASLRGPGIETTHTLSLPEIDAFQRNAALYPLGLDFLFTSADRIAGLPRSTRVS